jgi:N-methylhydantoinase A
MTVGVDTGGTFTDVVVALDAEIHRFKVLSTPADPAGAVLAALVEAVATLGPRPIDRLTYGTTVATNAMLERRGARTALVTTAGFEDLLEIGRQARPDLYDLEPRKIPPLLPRPLRLGVAERTLFDGKILRDLTKRETDRLIVALRRLRVESVAVSLLHAPANAKHERAIALALRVLRVPVSLSSALAPAPGEYERTSTAVANAYVRPAVEHHLQTLRRRTRARTLRVLQSNGGAIGLAIAAREPIRTMLSGPAGGVAAATEIARRARCDRVITLDMGGTSTDVSLVEGVPARRATTEIGGIPIRTPCLDIHTVGAGGGSIASMDEGGALRVGPESAGADPGPACYGRGRAATVTDANLVLGRLRADAFLGGRMHIDIGRAEASLARLASLMGARSTVAAAEGVVRVVESTMERAIRVITIERGTDPRGCTLVPFGGAAGLHACRLAEDLGIHEILVPLDPGLLSAYGMLDAQVVRDAYRALRLIDPRPAELARHVAALARRLRRDLAAEHVARSEIRIEAQVELRYVGEGSTLDVPLASGFTRRFHVLHQRTFHSSDASRPIECCGVRVTGIAESSERARKRLAAPVRSARQPRAISRPLHIDGRRRAVSVLPRESLSARARLSGPAIVTELSSTLLVRPGWTLRLDDARNLRLERGRSG